MKPFSKFEAISGKPVVTRDGRPVTQIKEFETTTRFQVAGVLNGKIETWTDDGVYFASPGDNRDLFMASTKKEGWIAYGLNYKQEEQGLVGFCTHVFPTEAQARDSFYRATFQQAAGATLVSWEL